MAAYLFHVEGYSLAERLVLIVHVHRHFPFTKARLCVAELSNLEYLGLISNDCYF